MNILIAAGKHIIEAGTLFNVLSLKGHAVQKEFYSESSSFNPDLVVCYDSSIRFQDVPVVQVLSPDSTIGSTNLVVVSRESLIPDNYHGSYAVIPQAVDTDIFKPCFQKREKMILAPGRLDPEMGHKTLIQAMALINPAVSTVIAGREAHYTSEKLLSYASSLGVENRLQIVTESAEVASLYNRATLGVVTALDKKSASCRAREIMASGLPLLTSSTEDLCDLITDGLTGLLHSPGNWKQLAGQINHLMENKKLTRTLGYNAREYCETHLSYRAVGNRWTEVMEQLCFG